MKVGSGFKAGSSVEVSSFPKVDYGIGVGFEVYVARADISSAITDELGSYSCELQVFYSLKN